MKKIIQSFFRYLGFDLKRYLPSNSAPAQLIRVLELAKIDLIFDIGANKGQFVNEIRENGYMGNIVSFEPLSSARSELLLSASKDPLWVVHEQSAIGDQDGEAEIFIAGNSVSSSLLEMLDSHSNAAVDSHYINSERVLTQRLDSIASRYAVQGTSLFIKIDTQGFEWQVLDGASQILQDAMGVLCELSLVPLYNGQRLWLDIVDRLDREGFMLWAVQKGFTDSRTGQSLQMDGIFMRKSFVATLVRKDSQ